MKRPSAVVWQEFQNLVNARGGRVVEPEWLGVRKPHRVACELGHNVTVFPGRLKRGGGLCRVCSGRDSEAAWQAFRERVAELGGQVVEPEWLGCMKRHRVICKNGHEVTPMPNWVQQGSGLCKTCAGNDTAAAEKAFRERIAELGARIVEPNWLGSSRPHRVTCSQGHDCRPRPHDVAQGHGICLNCVGNDPAVTSQAFRDAIAAIGGRVVELTWLGMRKQHRIICGNGHLTTAYPATVARGGAACSTCAGRSPDEVWRAFRERVAELGGQVVEPAWLGSFHRHRVVCREGHACAPMPASIGQGQGLCRICAGNDSGTAWRLFCERVVALGGQVAEAEWLGSEAPHRVICREGHKTTVHPASVRSGQGLCRFCKGKTWDAFYVVANDQQRRVKFGITSGDVRHRLRAHRADGFGRIVKTVTGIATAHDLESAIRLALRAAGAVPVKGREYFDLEWLAAILNVVESWLSAERTDAPALIGSQLTLF